MKCPFCGELNSRVIDSRPTDNGEIRRRRECESCHKRFTTYERIESIPLMVIKKDNTREPYDRDKIKSGISRSCHKRPVSTEVIDKMTDAAYVRFASVYREFKDVNTFLDEIQQFLNK